MEPMKPMKPMKPMQGMAPMKPMKPMEPPERWWPEKLGTPSSSGSQNDTRYAYFADAQRLVVDDAGKVTTYDTGSKRINGFSQQQGSGRSMTFDSDAGSVELGALPVVD